MLQFSNRLNEVENKPAAIGNSLTESEKKRALLRGLDVNFSISAGVIKVIGNAYHAALAYPVACEVEHEVESITGAGTSASALTTMERNCEFYKKL